jgi:hypothetical protein
MKIPILLAKFALATLFIQASNAALAAPKTDILIFHNGDRLTGEIKSLKRGRLSFNTDATGTINIEWDKVAQLISNQFIQLETNTGARFFGQLVQPSKDFRLVVETTDGPQILDPKRVIIMNPIEQEKGLGAFDIDVTVGYNFAKATGVKQATLGFNIDYRTRLRIFSFSTSNILSDSNSQESSRRHNVNFQFTRLWKNRWTSNGNVSLEQNDELGLNLRTSIGFGGGRFLIQSNSMLLGLEAGLQIAQEDLVDVEEDTQSIEAVFTGVWDWFRFDSPELDWSNTLKIIPSLTESGRVRGEFDTNLKWEMFNDLKWGLSVYSSYDSKPQTENASNSDYGVNTTLTYEF